MTADVGYWYNAQIRTLILHTQRLFSNFYVSNGKKDNGEDDLIRVPCVFMSTDKSTVNLINKNTDTILESAPKMVLTISELKLNNNKISGSPYYELTTDITEKKFNESTGDYEYKPGNTYEVKRLNPLPIGITFKLYILTTMQTHKFQLFEQIRMMFSPTLELQTSENPLDWSRLSALTLTNVSYSSRGVTNLDSTQLDSMDLTFELDTNLDAPAITTRQTMIEKIVTEIGEGNSIEDIYGWTIDDTLRVIHTPSSNTISIDNNNEVTLLPSANIKNWYDLFKSQGILYNSNKDNVFLHCIINYDENKKKVIYGSIIIDNINPNKALWNYEQALLPSENIKPINAVIDPHDFRPNNIEGERYILDDEISDNTVIWGKLKNINGDFIHLIPTNCIIEYINGYWTLVLNPKEQYAIYYVRDLSEEKYLYSYNDNYDIWYDVINKKYRAGSWRLSTL